ncbi:hypothetical protein MPER_10439 [Moniliophthora perniciosa FA553]|nr:hypothetical protein MPER_10439 [Moniliophthora perniciosa FA553]
MFNNVQGAAISGDAVNIVHRDQYIGATTIINRIFRVEGPGRTIVKKERKRHDTDSGYDQYREIIRGDIHILEQLSSKSHEDGKRKDGKIVWTHSYRVTAHRAQVYDDDRVFTAISYHGRDAKKVCHRSTSLPGSFFSSSSQIWKKEFMKWSRANDPAALLQLFAINRSKIPTLLFDDEWLPMGYLQTKAKGTFWECLYLHVYTNTWQNKPEVLMLDHENGLWLNSRTGRFSSGPKGPFTRARGRVQYLVRICLLRWKWPPPTLVSDSSAKLEPGMTLMCYNMPPKKAPTCVLRACWVLTQIVMITAPHGEGTLVVVFGIVRLVTISRVQLDKIAISKEGPAYRGYSCVLRDQTLMDSGLMRFQFGVLSQGIHTIHFNYIYIGTSSFEDAWLSQAHRLDLPASGSETCFIPRLQVYLQLDVQREQFGVPDLANVSLFLRPPPLYVAEIDSWLSQITFWSFDENGTSEISETECKRLGLPNINLHCVDLDLRTWPKHVYNGLHAWQVARGFDPTTADWARSRGLPILEPAITRFEEVVEGEIAFCYLK